jgi:hypothetical protein
MVIIILSGALLYIGTLWLINRDVLKQVVSTLGRSLRPQRKADAASLTLGGTDRGSR